MELELRYTLESFEGQLSAMAREKVAIQKQVKELTGQCTTLRKQVREDAGAIVEQNVNECEYFNGVGWVYEISWVPVFRLCSNIADQQHMEKYLSLPTLAYLHVCCQTHRRRRMNRGTSPVSAPVHQRLPLCRAMIVAYHGSPSLNYIALVCLCDLRYVAERKGIALQEGGQGK